MADLFYITSAVPVIVPAPSAMNPRSSMSSCIFDLSPVMVQVMWCGQLRKRTWRVILPSSVVKEDDISVLAGRGLNWNAGIFGLITGTKTVLYAQ